MKARLPRSWIVLIGIFLVGCGHHGESYSDNGSAPTPDQLAAEKPLADSLDAFAFRLKDQIVATDRGKNICFSPISMQFALSTLLNGTAGKSVDSLRSVLGFGKVPLDQVNAANKALADNLSGPDVTIANAIWLNSAIQPLPDFTKRLEDFYAADFFADPFDVGTLGRINSWVSDHTKKRISGLFDHLSVGAQVVLVNAATFDGHWAHEFDPRHTDDEPFRTAGGQDVQVKMMHLSGADLPCTNRDQESGIAAVELPYLGGQYAMLLILPPEDQNVYDFAKRLSPDALHRLLGKLTDEEVELGLPRFEMFDSHDIMDYLASKGLKNIDLGAISPQLTPSDALDQVVQKTWIETDEEGTRAAVASGSSDVGSSTTQMPIIFNRPFIFIVRHESTGAILFFGIVQNPLG